MSQVPFNQTRGCPTALPVLTLIALARSFFLKSRHLRTLGKRGFNFSQSDAARFEQHQPMKDKIGAFSDQMPPVIFDGGNHRLDRLLTELLGAMFSALIQELSRIRRLPARFRTGVDGGGKITDRETGHDALSITST